jgi:hypothetical protein
MEKQKINIQISTTEEDNVFFIYSKEMKCEYVIKKDLNLLKNEIADLVEEWLDIREVL